MEAKSKCPKCGRTTSTPGDRQHVWYCHHCRAYFEDVDDGDVGYGRPEKRLERAERQGTNRRVRR